MKKIILTCEHAGNNVPKAYKNLFKNHSAALNTHRGLDIGALAIAKDLQKTLKTPLHYSEVTRLLVDLNRFKRSKSLFSEMTKSLSRSEKKKILTKYYDPHWNQIEKIFTRASAALTNQLVHVAVHSMTDNINGQVRKMQLALLYDPKRPSEKKLCELWIKELKKQFPNYIIAKNNPYKGTSEGVTCYYRKKYSQKFYTGIELEMNQALLMGFTPTERKSFSRKLAVSLQHAVYRIKST